jgi:phosphopantetheinyl transferase (holo-ACP synthase)
LISIGNDIVALGSINEQRTHNSRFHSKFISDTELALYQNQYVAVMPFQSFVWLLWSVKESVYKYRQRLNPQLVFSPIKIIVQHINIPAHYGAGILITNTWEGEAWGNNFCCGDAIIDDQKLCFKSIISDAFIATVVTDEPSFKNIYWGVQMIDDPLKDTQSRSVRTFLLNKLETIFPQGSNLTLQKGPFGYPVLLNNDIGTNIPVSLAHHGCFTSYCFRM